MPVRAVVVAKLVIPGILFAMFLILVLYTFFLTRSFFPTSLSLLKSTGTVSNLLASNLSILVSTFFYFINI